MLFIYIYLIDIPIFFLLNGIHPRFEAGRSHLRIFNHPPPTHTPTHFPSPSVLSLLSRRNSSCVWSTCALHPLRGREMGLRSRVQHGRYLTWHHLLSIPRNGFEATVWDENSTWPHISLLPALPPSALFASRLSSHRVAACGPRSHTKRGGCAHSTYACNLLIFIQGTSLTLP